MKKNKQIKKLNLTKITVSKLSKNQLSKVIAGASVVDEGCRSVRGDEYC